MAHRTTGNAPCMVHFSAIDRNRAVRASSNITGVTFGDARNLTAAGTGAVAFTASGQTISYAAPGDSAGTPLALTVNLQSVKLYSANGVDWIYIDVTYASLPVGNQSDNITITTVRATGVQQPTAVLDPGDPDYGSLAYYWDFGDSNAITYTLTNNRNSNTCWGAPQSAHLYTTPGTYTVKLYVWDTAGVVTVHSETITITRQEDTATIYYVDATSGNNGNAGTNPAAPLQTFAAAAAKVTGNNIMLKFKRGETFSVAANITVNNSNVTFGHYYNSDGTDDITKNLPAFTIAPTTGTWIQAGSGISDLKLCGLRATGPGSGSSTAFGPSSTSTPTQNTLIYDCYLTAFHSGITQQGSAANWGNSGIGIVHTDIYDLGFGLGANGVFCELTRGAVLGTRVVDLIGGEHCVRIVGGSDAVVADNYFKDPGGTKCALTFRGHTYGATNSATGLRATSNTYIAILRNQLDAGSLSGNVALSINPTNTSVDERIEHVIIDSNYSLQGHQVGGVYQATGRDFFYRNNVGRGGGNQLGFSSKATAPHSEWLRAVNNTFITDSTANTVVMFFMNGADSGTASDSINSVLKNNIWVKGSTSTNNYLWQKIFSDIANHQSDYNLLDIGGSGNTSYYQPDGGGITIRNLANTQSALSRELNSIHGSALFTNAGSGDYTLQSGSSAIGLGDDTLLPWVRFDAAGNLRTADIDAGAYEYGASQWTPPGNGHSGLYAGLGVPSLYSLYD